MRRRVTGTDRGGPLRWVDAVLVLLALAVVAVWVLALDRTGATPPGGGASTSEGIVESPVPTPVAEQARILWLGDSLQGVGVEDPVRDVVGPVSTDLARDPVRFDGSLRAANGLRSIIRATPDAEAVVLLFGTDSADVATFAPRFQGLVEEVRRTLPDADLVCVGPWRTDPAAPALLRAIDRSCAEVGGRVVDVTDLAATPELRAADGRPSPAGADQLTARLLIALDAD